MVRNNTTGREWAMTDNNELALERLALEWQTVNQSMGKSPETIRWYNMVVRGFLKYLKEQSLDATLGDLNTGTARQYILHLQSRPRYEDHPNRPTQTEGLSPTSVRGYVVALRVFASWLYDEGYTSEHRLRRVKPPKAPRRLVNPLIPDEIALIVSSINSHTIAGSRNLALVIVMLDSGLRLSEAASLEMDGVDLKAGTLRVFGKGAKERLCLIGAQAQKSLIRWFHFRPEPTTKDQVFLNLDGSPMTANSAKLVFRRLAKSSGVTRLHAHLLRHTFATQFIENGGDVFTLQALMGHSTLEMSRRYCTVNPTRIEIRRLSPVDNLGLKQLNRAMAQGGQRRQLRKSQTGT